jgi:hypothetical protein
MMLLPRNLIYKAEEVLRAESSILLELARKLHRGTFALALVPLVMSLTGCGGTSAAAPAVVSAALVSIAVTQRANLSR